MDAVLKAQAAEEFLKDPLLQNVFEDLKRQAYIEIGSTQPDEGHKRELIYFELLALERIRDKLQSYVNNQKIAEKRNK